VLWKVGTAIAPTMRRFQSFEKRRAAIDRAAKRKRVEPVWWKTKKRQHQEAAGGSIRRRPKEPVWGSRDGEIVIEEVVFGLDGILVQGEHVLDC
jgi:hypothetical protein